MFLFLKVLLRESPTILYNEYLAKKKLFKVKCLKGKQHIYKFLRVLLYKGTKQKIKFFNYIAFSSML